MRRPASGHNGHSHTPGNARDAVAPQRWLEVPDEVVWEFAVNLCAVHKLRGVAKMVKLAPETVRKFILRIGDPNFSTRRCFAELYLDLNAGGVVVAEHEWRMRPKLIELLPPGKREAREALAKLFELAKRFPDEVPQTVDELHDWLDLQVCGEYWAEQYYGEIARGKRKHDHESFLARIPKRRRKGAEPEGDEGSGE
jgi:hypothetical protein